MPACLQACTSACIRVNADLTAEPNSIEPSPPPTLPSHSTTTPNTPRPQEPEETLPDPILLNSETPNCMH